MSDIKIGLIGGSGLGQALGSQVEGQRHEVLTPFGAPSDAIIETEWAGVPVFVLSRHGPGHLLNPSQVPYRANLFAFKQLGVTHVLASGAVGSLREAYRPRDLVIADQVIDKTHQRANTFYEKAAVHVEFAEPFCPILRQILVEAGKKGTECSVVSAQCSEAGSGAGASAGNQQPPTSNSLIHERGCYVCMEGPAFSTRAESLMHRLWGGDLIGMTLMPEAKLAREAEMAYAAVALVTDYDCWRTPAKPTDGEAEIDPFALLKEIIGNLQAATDNAIALMRRAVELMAGRQEQLQQSPALQALRLGIWSDKSKIDPAEVQRLGPLWSRYFQA